MCLAYIFTASLVYIHSCGYTFERFFSSDMLQTCAVVVIFNNALYLPSALCSGCVLIEASEEHVTDPVCLCGPGQGWTPSLRFH